VRVKGSMSRKTKLRYCFEMGATRLSALRKAVFGRVMVLGSLEGMTRLTSGKVLHSVSCERVALTPCLVVRDRVRCVMCLDGVDVQVAVIVSFVERRA